jgi:hypothetical protein
VIELRFILGLLGEVRLGFSIGGGASRLNCHKG